MCFVKHTLHCLAKRSLPCIANHSLCCNDNQFASRQTALPNMIFQFKHLSLLFTARGIGWNNNRFKVISVYFCIWFARSCVFDVRAYSFVSVRAGLILDKKWCSFAYWLSSINVDKCLEKFCFYRWTGMWLSIISIGGFIDCLAVLKRAALGVALRYCVFPVYMWYMELGIVVLPGKQHYTFSSITK